MYRKRRGPCSMQVCVFYQDSCPQWWGGHGAGWSEGEFAFQRLHLYGLAACLVFAFPSTGYWQCPHSSNRYMASECLYHAHPVSSLVPTPSHLHPSWPPNPPSAGPPAFPPHLSVCHPSGTSTSPGPLLPIITTPSYSSGNSSSKSSTPRSLLMIPSTASQTESRSGTTAPLTKEAASHLYPVRQTHISSFSILYPNKSVSSDAKQCPGTA